MELEPKAVDLIHTIRQHIARVFIGKEDVIDQVLIAMVSRGHVLIEDVPGLGKTTLVKALAKSVACRFSRIQFTPDVLPSDVTGYTIINQKTGQAQVIPGAVMAQIVLADEINRTGPKTQSSLLEVMQEGQVTIDGHTYPVPQPFFVLATQNPVGSVGTYPLPESQLDRFLINLSIGYPQAADESKILKDRLGSDPLVDLEPVASADDVCWLQSLHDQVTCSEAVRGYIVSLASKTRNHDQVALGISPRGSLALMRAAMGRAMLNGRTYTLPDDVKAMVQPVFAHRLILTDRHRIDPGQVHTLLADLLRSTAVPKGP